MREGGRTPLHGRSHQAQHRAQTVPSPQTGRPSGHTGPAQSALLRPRGAHRVETPPRAHLRLSKERRCILERSPALVLFTNDGDACARAVPDSPEDAVFLITSAVGATWGSSKWGSLNITE